MGIFNWGFRANLKVHNAPEYTSASLKSRSGTEVKLNQFIQLEMSLLNTKLWLHPLLFNGALQTIYYNLHNSTAKFLVYYGRELFEYSDGGRCSLDWAVQPEDKETFDRLYKETLPETSPRLHPRTRFFTSEELKHRADAKKTSPIVIVFHGLAGGSHEPLIRNFAEEVQRKTPDWDVVVANSRGCCRTKVTNDQLYTALSTGDVKEVVQEFEKRYPGRALYAVGFSFGSAILSNYMAQEKDSRLKAVCLIGCPWDLNECARHIQTSWTGKYLLNPALTRFLAKLVKSNFAELSKHNPEFFTKEALDTAFKSKVFEEFDDLFTSQILGYKNAAEYYKDASPARTLENITTPTLAISSTDDPTVSSILPIEKFVNNPNLVLVESDLGGHLGFVKTSGEFWCVEVAEEFFRKYEEVVV